MEMTECIWPKCRNRRLVDEYTPALTPAGSYDSCPRGSMSHASACVSYGQQHRLLD
ncbi:hypothetical protein BJV77DRAFT_999574 [Russula vinacea]|nr:hypothetical protein BJV77DRAFT_999574 [Russula vinacea]